MKLKESREDDKFKDVPKSMNFIDNYLPFRYRPHIDYIVVPGQHCSCGRSRFPEEKLSTMHHLNSFDRIRYYESSESIFESNQSVAYLTKKNVILHQFLEMKARRRSKKALLEEKGNQLCQSALKTPLDSPPSNATLMGSIERRLSSSVSSLQKLIASSSKFVDLFRGIALYYFFCLNTILAKNDILKRKTFSIDNALLSLDLPVVREDVVCFDTLNVIFNALKKDSQTGKCSTIQFVNHFDRKIMRFIVEDWFLDAMLRRTIQNRTDFDLLVLLSQKDDWLPSTARTKYRTNPLYGYLNDIIYRKMVLFAEYIENDVHENVPDGNEKALMKYLRKCVSLYPPDFINALLTLCPSLHDVIFHPSWSVIPPSSNYLMPSPQDENRPSPAAYYPSESIYPSTPVVSEIFETDENTAEKNYVSSNSEQNNVSEKSSDVYPTSTASPVGPLSTDPGSPVDTESTDTGYTSREKGETGWSSPEKNEVFIAAVEEFLSTECGNYDDEVNSEYGSQDKEEMGISVEHGSLGEEEMGISVEKMLSSIPTGLLEDDNPKFPQYNMWTSSFELTENFRKLRSSVDHHISNMRQDSFFTDQQICHDFNFSLFSNGDALLDARNTEEIKCFDMWLTPQFSRCLPELTKMMRAEDTGVDIFVDNFWDSNATVYLKDHIFNSKLVFFTNSGAFEYYKKARSISTYEKNVHAVDGRETYECDKEELDLDAEIEALIFKNDATDAEYAAAGLNKDHHFKTIDPVPRVAVDPQPKYSLINSCTFWVEGRPNRYMTFKHELDDPDATDVFQPCFEMSKKDVACQVDFFMATHGSQSTNFNQAEYSLFPQAGSKTYLSTVLNNTNLQNSSSRYLISQNMSHSMNSEAAGCSLRNSIHQSPSSVSFFSTNNFLENPIAGGSYMS